MNKQSKRILVALAVLLLLALSMTGVLAQTDDTGLVRFVHAIPGASAIDIYIDGSLSISNLEFGEASTFLHSPTGDRLLSVMQTGSTTPLWEQTYNAAAGSAQTFVAASASEARFQVYVDDLTAIALGKARLTAIHAIAGGPDVDLILTDGRPVIPGLKAGAPAGTLDVPAFAYDFAVVPAGGSAETAVLTPPALPLASGTSYAVVIYGTAESPAALVLSAATNGDASGGLVRIAHGVAGAPAVDVYLNDTLAVPSLAFGEMTEHVALPSGSYTVALRGAGSETNLLSADVEVAAGQAVTIAALGTPDNVSAQVLTDNIAGVTAAQARLSLVNGLDGETISATLADGTDLGTDLAFATASDGVDVAPNNGAISVTVSGGDSVEIPAQPFYGGVYYNLLAVDDNGTVKLFVAETSLAQGIASAPGAGSTAVVVEPPPVIEATAEATVAPTEAPVAFTTTDGSACCSSGANRTGI
jgi:hypothetical protein